MWERSPRAYKPDSASNPPDSQQSDAMSMSISESLPAPSELEFEENNCEGLNKEDRGEEIRSRIHARMAAFRAVEEGSYNAWADVSLVSARHNHAEEEMEL